MMIDSPQPPMAQKPSQKKFPSGKQARCDLRSSALRQLTVYGVCPAIFFVGETY